MIRITPLLWVTTLCLLTSGSSARSEEKVFFNRDIRPILSDRCFLCHGPDADNRQADLRLDLPAEAHRSLEFGTGTHVIKPGDPAQSEVFLRITSTDPALRMPPPESKLELTAQEIEIVQRWIKQGAEYEGHWAFIPPEKSDLPPVQNESWVHNDIDRFILHQIESSGLSPQAPATKEKLLRRVSFDLTGLPPSLSELDAFLTDDSEEAYEKAVDRLLASEKYGERLATDWLDVARYSDTYGYQVDRDRFVWPWRDWVIRAFNANLPYDQFIVEQLSGDLLPGATDEQILATTFNRLHPQKVEGGSTPEEFRIEYVADRTQTFGTAFLGLTLECCRCHDHKFDPITQKEYYQFTAFFDNIDESGLYSFFTPAIPTPTLLLASDAQKIAIQEKREAISKAEEQLQTLRKTQHSVFQEWQKTPELGDHTVTGELLHLDFETVNGPNKTVEGVRGHAAQFTGDDAINTEVGNFKRSQPFSVSLWIKTPDLKDRAVIYHRSRAWTDAGSRGYELLLEEGKLSTSLIHFWPGNAISIKTLVPLPINSWQHAVITYDGSSTAAGLRIFLNGVAAECEVVRDNLTRQITGGGGDNIALGERFRDRGFKQGQVDEFRVFGRKLTSLEAQRLNRIGDANPTGALPTETQPAAEEPGEAELFDYYLNTQDDLYRQQLTALEQKREELNSLIDGIPEIMVMQEMPQKKPTYRLVRGEYTAPAEEVTAETPASLPPLAASNGPPNRLALARWLTAKEHPLTARVTVNRFWQVLFGAGLVRTPEDFGSQGALPTHPELLDWLAVDFIEHGWDTKRLMKQIVMSATYRQASGLTSELLQADPENRLLARAPSYRLSAEMLRDNALAVSGLLVQKIGGDSVKPYEVEVSFKPVARAKGEGLYRRSLYTYWKRTSPAPDMMTLDASLRDVCRVKRDRTSSPLQAFVMFNGPQFVEASRGLAQRLSLQHGTETTAILKDMFRLLTSRHPNDQEMGILLDLHQHQLALFTEHPEDARNYLTTGDLPVDPSLNAAQLAATTAVANALLNFDECVIKR